MRWLSDLQRHTHKYKLCLPLSKIKQKVFSICCDIFTMKSVTLPRLLSLWYGLYKIHRWPFTLNIFISLYLKWLPGRYDAVFKTLPENICLLLESLMYLDFMSFQFVKAALHRLAAIVFYKSYHRMLNQYSAPLPLMSMAECCGVCVYYVFTHVWEQICVPLWIETSETVT